jgi:WD40 repeat protein
MFLPDEDSSARERRLDEVIAEYFQLAERGHAVDPQTFLDRYPDLADDLSGFFTDKAAFDVRVSMPMPAAAESASTPREPIILLPPRPAEDTALGLEEDTALPGSRRSGLAIRFSDFELVEEIASGSSGVVWRAQQVSLNRVLALKMIAAGQLASHADVARFRAEADAAGNLDHPNIVPIYEVGEHAGQHYYTMKLIRGSNLAQRIGDLVGDPTRAVQILLQVARAVHYAHVRGILHRDLKPANVILDVFGTPYVTEFGLARWMTNVVSRQTDVPVVTPGGRTTLAGAVPGTPSYMSPEQARADRHLTTASDVWSLGAILYECLTGQPPFRGDSPVEAISAVLESEPVPPREFRPGLSPDLETICLECLQKEPGKRYAGAGELADDLSRWLHGEPIQARPSRAWQRSLRWLRKRPAVAAVAGIAVLLALAGIGGIVREARQAESARRDEAERADKEVVARRNAEVARAAAERRADGEANAKAVEGLALSEARRTLYLQQIALARQAWQTANLPRMQGLLASCPPDHRAWEWGYLRRLGHGELRALSVGRGASQLAFSPDGKLLAVVALAERETVHLFDPLTGVGVRCIEVGDGNVSRIAFSPDGKRLAIAVAFPLPPAGATSLLGASRSIRPAGTANGIVHLYDPQTGKSEIVLGAGTPAPGCLAFSPDGKLLAAGGKDQLVRLWKTDDGKLVGTLSGHGNEVHGICFHPAGKRLASLTRDELKIWDLASGKEAVAREPNDIGGSWLEHSPDGRLLAVADRRNTIAVLDSSNCRLLRVLAGHGDAITRVAFHPDGRSLASAAQDRTVRLWNPHDGTPLTILRGHSHGVMAVAFSADGRMLASSARTVNSPTRGEVKLWDATRDDQSVLTLHGQSCRQVCDWTMENERRVTNLPPRQPAAFFHTGGERLTAATARGELKTWDVRTGEILSSRPVEGDTISRLFSPDQRWLAAIVRQANVLHVRLFDASTGNEGTPLESPEANATGLAFSSDGRRLGACSGSGAKVWEVVTGKKLFAVVGHATPATRLSFGPDGRWLATAADMPLGEVKKDNIEVKLHDLAPGQTRTTNLPNSATTGPLAFSPDGSTLITAGVGGALLWKLPPGTGPAAVLPHQRSIATLAVFSKDSATLATADTNGTAYLWDVKSGRLSRVLGGHTRSLASLVFTPDGRRLISSASVIDGPAPDGRQPGELKVWDPQSGREILTLDGQGEVLFSADGQRLAAVGKDDNLRIWDATQSAPRDSALHRQAWLKDKQGWHENRAAECESGRQYFAAAFHLSELIRLQPKQMRLYQRLKETRKSIK